MTRPLSTSSPRKDSQLAASEKADGRN
jgi:hypothetical protein